MTTPTTPPLSPDGTHWWDGAVWLPVSPPAAQPPYAAGPRPPYAAGPGDPYATWQPDGRQRPGQPQGYGWPGAPGPAATSGLAVTSLVLSVLWLGGIGSIAGLVTGLVARGRIRASRGALGGGGLATAGIAVGAAGFGLMLLWAVVVPSFLQQQHQQARAEVTTTLRNAAVAEESFYTENGTYTDSLPALVREGLDPRGVTVTILSASETGYCMAASDGRQTRWLSNNGFSPSLAPCG